MGLMVEPARRAAAGAAVRVGTERRALRFCTAGSVDDGKSTLIGRLLYDSRAIAEDALQALAGASQRRGEALNLALLTDGLRAEREQNITIDVAYRYFATPRRRFVIADTPGHTQYTRNLVTGASQAELALILLDARKGVLPQSRRHAAIAAWLGIRHFVIAVNKLDLMGWSREAFERAAGEMRAYLGRLGAHDVAVIPVSALLGDNVVNRSANMPWYDGPALLEHLETVAVAPRGGACGFRLPVQCVLRPNLDYRGFAGTVAAGRVRAGEEVLLLPSRRRTRVRSVAQAGEAVAEARAGEAAVVTLEEECDLSRGEMIVSAAAPPVAASRLRAALCWMAEAALERERAYILMHTTRATRAYVERVEHRLEIETLAETPAEKLEGNEIGRVTITTAQPVFCDRFADNPETGSFILVDPHTNATVAAGMIEAAEGEGGRAGVPGERAARAGANIGRARREARQGHRAGVVWFTGLSGSGKSTLARGLERRLFALGCRTVLLDGDALRRGLSNDLGFSPADRMENIRRASEVARLFYENGCLVLCAFVSPFRRDRAFARQGIGRGRFFEIHVDCPIEECRRRDTKGLYAAARAGALGDLTGVGQAYEPPQAPEWVARTAERTPEAVVEELVALLRARGLLPDARTPRAR